MESRFGNTAAISRSLLEQLVEKAKFDENDRKRLQEFSDLCMDVTSQLDLLPGLACLNYPIAIRPIVERRPTSLQRKWEKKVVTYAIDNDDDYPDFRAFATTIERQAKTKNHPNILAKEVIRITSRPVKRLEEGRILKGDVEVGDKKHCRFHTCDGCDLKDGKTFARKPLQDRLEWLKKSGLCFRCLLPNHIAKNCKAEIRCSECNSDRHLALLHRERKKENSTPTNPDDSPVDTEMQSNCTDVCKNSDAGLLATKIVLVDVFTSERPENIHRVYALLDEQSNVSMVSPELADKLGKEGEKEKYLLSTCSGSKEVRYGRRLSGIIARPLNGEQI